MSRHRFNTIPTQISPKRFIDIHEAVLKVVWKGKGTRRVKTVLKTRERGICLSHFIVQLSTQDCRMGREGEVEVSGTEQRTQE